MQPDLVQHTAAVAAAAVIQQAAQSKLAAAQAAQQKLQTTIDVLSRPENHNFLIRRMHTFLQV